MFAKNNATTIHRGEKDYWKMSARQMRAHSKPTKLLRIQTELCVTLSTLDSFEPEGFERILTLASRLSVRPSAAAFTVSFSEEVRGGKERALLLRKEVIQPQVPLRLPCYDFIPITGHTLGTRGHFGYNRLS